MRRLASVFFSIILIPMLMAQEKTKQETFPHIDVSIKKFDETVAEKKAAFEKIPADPNDIEWVQKKLIHMSDVDQYMRNYSNQNDYNAEEQKYFLQAFLPHWMRIDRENTEELKKLLKIYHWITISKFGRVADQKAWLIVQHADHDCMFQKEVLTILEKLYPQGETSRSNYAYLYDRVAMAKKRPQRYGTQGRVVTGNWEPYPIEDVKNVDQRREAMGMEPLDAYKKRCNIYLQKKPSASDK